MATYNASIDRDANRVPVPGLLPFKATKRITFTGGTANTIGDHDGTLDPFTIFDVTGDVVVDVIGMVKTSLEGASATLEVGVTNGTANILAQETGTDLDAGMLWRDGSVALAEAFTPRYIGLSGADIIGTVGTANITAGVIDFYCYWLPLSTDGLVTGD